MPVIYDSQKLIPAPFVSFRKEFHTAEDGRVIGTLFQITVQGELHFSKGSPDSSGTFWTSSGYPPDETLTHDERLKSLIKKQEALLKLFAEEGKTFEVQPLDGSAPFKCNPRIKGGVQIPEGQWVERCPYTINLEADTLIINGVQDSGDPDTYKVSSANEEWNIETLNEDQGTYRLTHAVSAQGKRFYDNAGSLTQQAWENAKDYVLNKIGLGLKAARMEAPDVLDESSLQAFNYQRSQSINEYGGSFSVSESWICYDPGGGAAAINDYNVSTRIGQDQRQTVSIDGNITGLEVRDNSTYVLTSSKWTNAQTKWTEVSTTLHDTAQTISGVTLNTNVLSQSIGRNPISGTISYSAEYDDRPAPTVSGAISQKVRIGYSNPASVFSRVVILGRPSGPLLQDIDTTTGQKRSISIEIQMPAATASSTPNKPNTDDLVIANKPSGTTVFLESDEENWEEEDGRYSRNAVYAYE